MVEHAIGYSRHGHRQHRRPGANAFKTGQYALGQSPVLRPVPNVMMGGELQWGTRENFSDGFAGDGFKVQFSFKYNFSVQASEASHDRRILDASAWLPVLVARGRRRRSRRAQSRSRAIRRQRSTRRTRSTRT